MACNKKISRLGYSIKKSNYKKEEIEKIITDLSVKPFTYGKFGTKFVKNICLYHEDGDKLYLPKYYGLEKLGIPDENFLETENYKKYKMNYLGELRPNQTIIVNNIINGFEKKSGGMLIAGCGIGKTNMAIYLACKYKLKTLFIVHKNFLKNQIIDRIKSVTNLKRVGNIQGKIVDIDTPIVVGMVHTIAKMDRGNPIFKEFGMIIIDEAHHMGARNFVNVLKNITTKYMLGITAEKSRNDGLFHVINLYLGPILHFEEQKINNMVIVKRFFYQSSYKERCKEVINKYTKEIDRSTMISNLVYIKKRNRTIINIIKELFLQGKNILCLSWRILQLNILYELLSNEKNLDNNVGYYLGGMKEEQLDESSKKKIILGTFSMAEEGLDIKNLDVVILCTPKSAIKQSVGRILRKEEYTESPIVIDIIDTEIEVFNNQSNKRKQYYKKQNYNVQDFYITDKQEKTNETFHMWDNEEYIKMALTKPIEFIKNKEIEIEIQDDFSSDEDKN